MYANIIPFVRMPYGSTSFTYQIPSELEGSIFIGQFVEMPLRKKSTFGVVHSLSKTPPKNVPQEKIASLTSVKESTPSWNPSQITTLEEYSRFYHCSLATLTKSFTPEIPKTKRSVKTHSTTTLQLPDLQTQPIPDLKLSDSQTIVYHTLNEKVGLIQDLVKKKRTLILSPQIEDAQELFQLLNLESDSSFLWDNQTNKTNQWDQWQAIKKRAHVVISSRSGLLVPIQNLEQIIIDSSESSDHKSWEASPNYDVREMARTIAEKLHIPLIQFSLAPRIANSSKWNLLDSTPAPIHSVIHKSASIPLHESIIDQIKQVHQEGKHVIIINNSKHEASTLRCLDCKFQWTCPNAHGTLHLQKEQLNCSSCDYTTPLPQSCPSCKGQRLKAFGLGLDGLHEWIKHSYSDVHLVTAQTVDEIDYTKPAFLLSTPYLLKRIYRNAPKDSVGKIIYLHPENLLYLPDYRANEWFFQTIQWHREVAFDYFGLELTLQTSMENDDGSLLVSIRGDSNLFRQEELKARKLLQYPPFSRLITITIKSPDMRQVGSVESFTHKLNKDCPYTILGPFLRYRKKKLYAYSWQIKQTTKNDPTLDKMLNSLYSKAIIDINPEQVV